MVLTHIPAWIVYPGDLWVIGYRRKSMCSSDLHSVRLSLPSVSRLISPNLLNSRVLLEGTLVVYGGPAHRSASSENDINFLALISTYREGRRRGDDPEVQIIGPGTTANYFLELDSKIQWPESWSSVQDERTRALSLGNHKYAVQKADSCRWMLFTQKINCIEIRNGIVMNDR